MTQRHHLGLAFKKDHPQGLCGEHIFCLHDDPNMNINALTFCKLIYIYVFPFLYNFDGSPFTYLHTYIQPDMSSLKRSFTIRKSEEFK